MNIQLKPLQVVFSKDEITVYFPSWYQETVERMQIIASPDIEKNQYGVANHKGLLYVLLSKEDAQNLQVHVIVETPQIEHIHPSFISE